MQTHETITNILKSLVPPLEEIISDMERNGGWLVFNDETLELLQAADFGKWSTLYLDKTKLEAAAALTVYDKEDLKSGSVTRKVVHEDIIDLVGKLETEDCEPSPNEEGPESISLNSNLSDAEQQEQAIQSHLATWGYVASLLNTISTMVHGRSMCQLLAAAIEGDNESLCRAAQIDRTIFTLPEIQNRLLVAQFSGDAEFLAELSYRIRNPVLKSKIRYKTLWVAFSVLDDEGLLELPHNQLCDLCEAVGVYGEKFGIQDVGHLSKRLQEYRRFQKM